ncbi:MAG: ThiF family adenylyltransferase, partial [Candidatus Tectimicrobiota bacterium]
MRTEFTHEEMRRYAYQMALPEVGDVGQAKLRAARVLIIGAGGLGSPAAIYLAAAGVGTLGVVDSDAVELSNLHRQILHTEEAVGQPKVESAQAML